MSETQQNPGGFPYDVLWKNNFSSLEGQQQTPATLEDAFKALTGIRPPVEGQKAPLTAQPVHDILSFLLSRVGDLWTRRSVLVLPGRLMTTGDYLFQTMDSQPLHHRHWIDSGGKSQLSGSAVEQDPDSATATPTRSQSVPAHMNSDFAGQSELQTLSHHHEVDLGSRPNLNPIWFHAFDPMLPPDAYVKNRGDANKVTVEFHIVQDPVATILNGEVDPPAVAAALDAAQLDLTHGGHQAWVAGFTNLADLGSGDRGGAWSVSDRFSTGLPTFWASTYDRHLSYWIYRAYYSGMINKTAGTAAHTLSYSLGPYGIQYHPGAFAELNSTNLPAHDFLQAIGRWSGSEPGFDFDQFVATSLWPAASLSVALDNYEQYIDALDRFHGDWDRNPAGVARFSDDSRVDNHGCRTTIMLAFTVKYEG